MVDTRQSRAGTGSGQLPPRPAPVLSREYHDLIALRDEVQLATSRMKHLLERMEEKSGVARRGTTVDAMSISELMKEINELESVAKVIT